MAIPDKNKQWQGQFPGNYSGNLWQTFNIDLERHPGRLILADKMFRTKAALGTVTKFIRSDANQTEQWWGLVNATDVLKNGNTALNGGTWATDDSTTTFNDPRDGLVHEYATKDRLFVTRATDIALLNNSTTWDDNWWSGTKSQAALTSLDYHPIARLQRLVAVGDKVAGIAVLHTIDKDDVITTSRLTFPTGYMVKNIYTSSDRFWIGLINERGGACRIIEWDGFSQTYNNEYDLVGSYPMVGFVVQDVPYFITEFGHVFRLGAGGFEKVQDFGLYETGQIFDTTVATAGITNYGAYVDGHIVNLVVQPPEASTESATAVTNGSARLRSGIWIFNTRNLNLYHNMGLGSYVSLGADVNYGSYMVESGAIHKLGTANVYVASAKVYEGDGAAWFTGASTESGIYEQIRNDSLINSNEGRNRGYFITSYIPIEEIEAMWEALWLKFKKFVSSENQIVVKWRTKDPMRDSTALNVNNDGIKQNLFQGTWADTTSFTAVLPNGVLAGDEVEILTGSNSGCLFNIASLSAAADNDSTITITTSETAPTTSTDKFLGRIDNWRTEAAITDTTIDSKKVPFTLGSTFNAGNLHGNFIQFKIYLIGHDVQIDELIPVNKTLTSRKQA